MPPLARPDQAAPPARRGGRAPPAPRAPGRAPRWRRPWPRGRSRQRAKPRSPKPRTPRPCSTPTQAGTARRCHRTAPLILRQLKHRRHRHEEQQGQADRDGDRVEEGRADGHLLLGDRLVEEREDGAEQHDEGEADEQDVVEQERALPPERRVDAARRAQAVAPPGDEPEADDDHGEEEPDQERPEGRLGEGVHRLMTPERVRKVPRMVRAKVAIEQREVPHPQQSPALLDQDRVQVGGAAQPRQEGGVLDRVPAPEAAPAEHLVGPPGAEDDARPTGRSRRRASSAGISICHRSPTRPVASMPTAKANGTVKPTKPR